MRKYNFIVYPLLIVVSLYNAKTPFMTRFCILYTVNDVIEKIMFPYSVGKVKH